MFGELTYHHLGSVPASLVTFLSRMVGFALSAAVFDVVRDLMLDVLDLMFHGCRPPACDHGAMMR